MARCRVPVQVFNNLAKPAANARVVVTNRRTNQPAVVYTTEDGTTPLTQPLVCDVRGYAPGWIDRGAYIALVSGSDVVAYTEEFDALPAWDGGLDSALLAAGAVTGDKLAPGSITVAKLDVAVKPVGTLFWWWAPAGTPHAFPAGCVVANGSVLVAGQHEFPGVVGSVTLPNLIDRMVVGADPTKTWGTASVEVPAGTPLIDQGALYAPGVNGGGGDNALRNLIHNHSYAHTHNVQGVDHLHTAGSYYASDHAHGVGIGFTTGIANRGSPNGYSAGAGESVAYTNHVHGATLSGSTGACGTLGMGGASGAADRSLNSFTTSQSATSTGSGGPTGLDVRPKHVGFVPLIKVRNS